MNPKRVAIMAALGTAAALCSVVYRHGHTVTAGVGTPAAAQTPNSTSIQIKSLPKIGDNDTDPWQHFEITVPQTKPPLDMHVTFLVDGKGTDYITEQSTPWQQKTPLKLRVDQDDDKRVKAILKAQNLPVNSRLVTYHFSYRSNGGADADDTLRFLHSSAGSGAIEQISEANGRIGDKIRLYQSVSYDDLAFKSPLYQPAANWHPEGYAKSLPAGFAHRLSVYLYFQPHRGPAIKNAVVFDAKPVQFPDNFDATKI